MSDDKDPLADPGHLFDQTNGMADGLEGDSDGTAESDEASAADRADERDQDPVSGVLSDREDDR